MGLVEPLPRHENPASLGLPRPPYGGVGRTVRASTVPNIAVQLDFTHTRQLSCSFKGPGTAYLFDTSHHSPDQSAGIGAAWYHLTAGGRSCGRQRDPPHGHYD